MPWHKVGGSLLVGASVLLPCAAAMAQAGTPLEIRLDGWQGHAVELELRAGVLAGHITGVDPYIVSPIQTPLITARQYAFAEIEMRTSFTGNAMMVWYQPGDIVAGVPLGIVLATPEFRTYLVPLRGAFDTGDGWTGGIERLRIDPTEEGSQGDFEIRAMRLLAEHPRGERPTAGPLRREGSRDALYAAPVEAGLRPDWWIRYLRNSRCYVAIAPRQLVVYEFDEDPREPSHTSAVSVEAWDENDARVFDLAAFAEAAVADCSYCPHVRDEVVYYRYLRAGHTQGIDCHFVRFGPTPQTPSLHLVVTVWLSPDALPVVSWRDLTGAVSRVDIAGIEPAPQGRDRAEVRQELLRIPLGLQLADVGSAQGAPTRVTVNTPNGAFANVVIPLDAGTCEIEVPRPATRVADADTGEALEHETDGSWVRVQGVTAGQRIRIELEPPFDEWRALHTVSPIPPGGEWAKDFINFRYPQMVYLWPGARTDTTQDGTFRMEQLTGALDEAVSGNWPVLLGLHGGLHWGDVPSYIENRYGLAVAQIGADGRTYPSAPDDGEFHDYDYCWAAADYRREIREHADAIMRAAKAHLGFASIIAYSSHSEPLVGWGRGGVPMACYNQEHVEWFRRWLESRWPNIETANQTLGTEFASFDVAEPPRDDSNLALWNEWKQSKTELIAEADLEQRRVIYQHDPNKPSFSHMIKYYCDDVDCGVDIETLTAGHDIDDRMFQSGMDTYISHSPGSVAYYWDPVRSESTRAIALPECYTTDFGAIYGYLVGAKTLFDRVLLNSVPVGPYGESWLAFSEIEPFLRLDAGETPMPDVAVLFSKIAGNFGPALDADTNLLLRNVSRCMVSPGQIEQGLLRRRSFGLVVCPNVTMVPLPVLEELDRIVRQGSRLWIIGDFALTDHYGSSGERFRTRRDSLVDEAALVQKRLTWDDSALALVDDWRIPVEPADGVLVAEKSRGLILRNLGDDRTFTVGLSQSLSNTTLAVFSDTGQVLSVVRAGATLRVSCPASGAVAVVAGGVGG